MKKTTLILGCILFCISNALYSQETSNKLTFKISFDASIENNFKENGRLFIFLNKNKNTEPRTQIWPSAGNYIFAKNFSEVDLNNPINITNTENWSKTTDWTLNEVPSGTYNIQVLWDTDRTESRLNAPGNIFSTKQFIDIKDSQTLQINLENVIPERTVADHKLLKLVDMKSDTLSKWWNKPMYLKATVLLPSGYYENPEKEYPIRYNVSGYGGRYNRINNTVNNKKFMDWWESADAPQIINVFLDGEGPFGDSYQMDSDNSGPYGFSLINELIPHIENKYRNTTSPKYRFVDGCSTGGWVSLGLQLYYPDDFNGCFSYSPDAIEFENYQLINIYKDKNAYTNEFGYERPVMRSTVGEPMMKLRDFIQYENVQGYSSSYLDSGGQFSAHTALYSPKGSDGLPKPLFDPKTGEIDAEVAEHWKKYDFKLHAKKHWATLGPKLQGKIYVWMGDMDHFYLNIATRAFSEYLETTENPTSDAVIEFTPTQGHCSYFSHRKVLEQIQERIAIIDQN